MRAFLDDFVSGFRKDPRMADLRQLAKARKWNFTSRRNLEKEHPDLQQFSLFDGRRGKRLVGIIRIKDKRLIGKFRIYDYVYFSNFGKRITTVFEFDCPKYRLSGFAVGPKKSFSSFRKKDLIPDLFFATTPEFTKNYQISAENPDETKIDLNIHFLDYIGDEPGWTYEGKGQLLIGYQAGNSLEPQEIIPELKRFVKICEQLVP